MTERKRRHDYGQEWEVATALWDGPLTCDEIDDHFRAYLRRLGFYTPRWMRGGERHDERLRGVDHAQREEGRGRHGDRRRDGWDAHLQLCLDRLVDDGWVVRDGQTYALTDLGREQAGLMLADVRRIRSRVGGWLSPRRVARTTLLVHLLLAAIKLPAGILSGSVALTNDGIDTLLDAAASLMAYVGLRIDRERTMTAVLVALILAVGLYAGYEAIRRIVVPQDPAVDWFALLAIVLSTSVFAALGALQRFVGLRSMSLALITQSVDSRNHVLVAGGVIVGLVAALMGSPLLDAIVGLLISLLIVKSGVELAWELWRSRHAAEPDLSRYRSGVFASYERLGRSQLREWLLGLVRDGTATTKAELVAAAERNFDFRDHVTLRTLGLSDSPYDVADIESAVDDLQAAGKLYEGEPLRITDAGLAALRRRRMVTAGWRADPDPGA